jgi:cytochrome c biogenesis protein CcmG/thiol:disulfide interchange protein DsbE
MTAKPKATAKPRSGAAKAASARSAPARPAAAPAKRSGRGALIALAIAAVVIAAAVIAVVVTRSGDASAGPQTYPVQLSGPPLAQFPEQPGAADPAIGQAAPALSGQSLFDGSPVTITPGGGSPQLVVFVAHWCPHCQREVPILVNWFNSAQKPTDLKVTAVSTSYNLSPENSPASTWLTKAKWPTPVLADSNNDDAAKAYGLSSFPYLVVLGPDGTVKGRTSGEMTADQITQFVNGALGR